MSGDRGAEVLGRWLCGYLGCVWEGDISNHHGAPPGSWCPGPHHATDEPVTGNDLSATGLASESAPVGPDRSTSTTAPVLHTWE